MVLFLQIEWKKLLLGEEEWSFLWEVGIRSFVMFVVILVALRMLGKRSVNQLSIFELGVIIGLGSAAGDPMFYKDVGLVVALASILLIVGLYRVTTLFINKSDKAEKVLEGTPVYLLEDGKIILKNFEEETIALEEFFSLMRQRQVTHLGQLKRVILETNGVVSAYYFEDKEVQWGLPVLPHLYEHPVESLEIKTNYACNKCGTVELLKTTATACCSVCGNNKWVKALNEKRIT